MHEIDLPQIEVCAGLVAWCIRGTYFSWPGINWSHVPHTCVTAKILNDPKNTISKNNWGYQKIFKPVFLVLAVLIQYDAKDFLLLVWRKIIVFVLSRLGDIHTLSVMFILLEAALLEDQTFCVHACACVCVCYELIKRKGRDFQNFAVLN